MLVVWFIGSRSWWLSGFFDSHTGRVKGDSMVKVWTTRSQNNTRHGQHATGTQHRCCSDVNTQTIFGGHILKHEQIILQMVISRLVTCTHSKQGRARRQRARAANKGKDVAHIGADAWLAEEQYTHVAEEQDKQLGPVFEQRRGIDVHSPAEAHAGQGRVCRPVACSGV